MAERTKESPYDAYYFAHSCGRPYERTDEWLSFFGTIADRIVADIAPESVLDAGCAKGFLVEALRDRGVEAYGVDVSEPALEQVRDDIQPYCWLGSVTDPFSRRYDLIVCIEVLEHLTPLDGNRALDNICSHTSDVLFASTPDDYAEATHLNVQPPELWAEAFAGRTFFREFDFDGSYITPWAARYSQKKMSLAGAVAAYERRLWHTTRENQQIRAKLLEQRDLLSQQESRLADQEAQLARLVADSQRTSDIQRRLQRLEAALAAIETAARTAPQQYERALRERERAEAEAKAARAHVAALERTRTLRYTAGARRLYGRARATLGHMRTGEGPSR